MADEANAADKVKFQPKPPLAVKLPALPGWRVVLLEFVTDSDNPDTGRARIHIKTVTFFGIPAPKIEQKASTLGMMFDSVARSFGGYHDSRYEMRPLWGETGEDVEFEKIGVLYLAPPTDTRSNEELLVWGSEWFTEFCKNAGSPLPTYSAVE